MKSIIMLRAEQSRLVDRLNFGGCKVFFNELGAILCRS